MDERDRLQRHIMDCLESKGSREVADVSYAISEYVMDALDSWIEEQGGVSKYPDGRRVKMIDNTTTSENLPYMYEEGTLVDKHRGYHTDHSGIVLVEWDQKYEAFHDGMGDTSNGVRCKNHHGWYVKEETLEFV